MMRVVSFVTIAFLHRSTTNAYESGAFLAGRGRRNSRFHVAG